jgi:hypothetical protein
MNIPSIYFECNNQTFNISERALREIEVPRGMTIERVVEEMVTEWISELKVSASQRIERYEHP